MLVQCFDLQGRHFTNSIIIIINNIIIIYRFCAPEMEAPEMEAYQFHQITRKLTYKGSNRVNAQHHNKQ